MPITQHFKDRIRNSRPAWATGDPISKQNMIKKKKNTLSTGLKLSKNSTCVSVLLEFLGKCMFVNPGLQVASVRTAWKVSLYRLDF